MEAAMTLGTAGGVISGPVYAPDPALPASGNRVLFTAARDGVTIPIPTHFFKIVLARVNGKRVAVGFLIPHRADLAIKDLGKFVVPIRVIENVTGIDFMPELGANEGLKMRAEGAWFQRSAAAPRP